MQFDFTESKQKYNYIETLPSLTDDFYEWYIMDSKVYDITADGKIVGYFGIFGGDKVTMFRLELGCLRYAQEIFKSILERYKIKTAFATTCDELMLAMCFDFSKSHEMQSYNFVYGGVNVREPEFGRELMKLAVPADEADILDTEGVAENIAQGKYYVMRQDGVFLGQGFYNRQNLLKNTVSIGMSVHPDHRRKGVGRSIIMHLAAIAREQGLIPICGCWYYNAESKMTLESAGFVTHTRLINFIF